MGRFATLNADTQDLINCLLPALAHSFGVSDVLDIIPEDIRMRAWDCERRDHIKDQTENDARNWGVQFLKDLNSISRLKGGNLQAFHADLRAKVALHEEKHPWCRLTDIKELKDEYEHPNRVQEVADSSSGTSSTDSYLEELHEPDLPRGSKRRNHEVYEARVQESHKRRKYGRLRRSDEGGFHRKEKAKGRDKDSLSSQRATPSSSRPSTHRRNRAVVEDDERSERSNGGSFIQYQPAPSFSISPAPARAPSAVAEAIDASDQPLHVQKMQAELEVAEAELKAARLKHQCIQAKERAEQEAMAKYHDEEFQDDFYD